MSFTSLTSYCWQCLICKQQFSTKQTKYLLKNKETVRYICKRLLQLLLNLTTNVIVEQVTYLMVTKLKKQLLLVQIYHLIEAHSLPPSDSKSPPSLRPAPRSPIQCWELLPNSLRNRILHLWQGPQRPQLSCTFLQWPLRLCLVAWTMGDFAPLIEDIIFLFWWPNLTLPCPGHPSHNPALDELSLPWYSGYPGKPLGTHWIRSLKAVTQLSGCHDYNPEVLLKAVPYLWIKCPAHWLHRIKLCTCVNSPFNPCMKSLKQRS